ncbi:MAG: hypothetical protein DF168_00149 [Candidatus Moanabacter tarae]|uniref:Uncharacterized protein n=1 Tax=Candidatus Moanibacter tarae TaxID=2200854 RepID=A0A2Z4AGC9_9BACT|nr:MAG: hypothetical protein DF168_00149 [Candidatus Moanabacter tarae]|tara:strand:+ start:22649 stop:22813 length:165 start_codon:yes stop_codon:yes gene_type:complete
MMPTILINKMVIIQANYFGVCLYKQGKGFIGLKACLRGVGDFKREGLVTIWKKL